MRVGDTKAMTLAKDESLPGKFVAGKEQVYANALNLRFQGAGVVSWIVDIDGKAAVVFEDGGRLYVMDNRSWRARWIDAATTPKPVPSPSEAKIPEPSTMQSKAEKPTPKRVLLPEPKEDLPEH